MLRRAPDAAYAAGLLCPPSGHVENGEDALSAAIRETANSALSAGQIAAHANGQAIDLG
jgi:hypothetical protein